MDFNTIGHHTVGNRGNVLELVKSGPVLSIHDQSNPKELKFLGTGYYFWDNNEDLSHFWGKRNYKGKYYIFTAEITCKDDENPIFDLVGVREHHKYMHYIRDKIVKKDPTKAHWGVGELLQYAIYLEENVPKYKGIFNFKAARAVDNSKPVKDGIKFVSTRDNFVNLNPTIVICLYSLNEKIMKNFKCVFTV